MGDLDFWSLNNLSLKELKELLRDCDDSTSFRRSEKAHYAIEVIARRIDGSKISIENNSFLWNIIRMVCDHDGWFDEKTVRRLLKSATQRGNFTKKQNNLMVQWSKTPPNAFQETEEMRFSRFESADGENF